jgi:hypothetical protein
MTFCEKCIIAGSVAAEYDQQHAKDHERQACDIGPLEDFLEIKPAE